MNSFRAHASFEPNRASLSAFQGLADAFDPLVAGERSDGAASPHRTRIAALLRRRREAATGHAEPSPTHATQKAAKKHSTVLRTSDAAAAAADDDADAADDASRSDDLEQLKRRRTAQSGSASHATPSNAARRRAIAPSAAATTAQAGDKRRRAATAADTAQQARAQRAEFEEETIKLVVEDLARDVADGSDDEAQRGSWPVWLRVSARADATPVTLHDEVLALAKLLSPLASESRVRQDVVERLRSTAVKLFGPCRLQVYGSLRAGCSLPSSDIDVSLIGHQFPRGSIRGRPNQRRPLQLLSRALIDANTANQHARRHEHHTMLPGAIKGLLLISEARVPLLKWADWQSGVDVDISFNMTDGALSSDWVQERVDKWPLFRPLLLVVKQLLKTRALHDPASGGVGSFTLSIMLSAFLHSRAAVYATRGDALASLQPDAPLRSTDAGRALREFFHFYAYCHRPKQFAVTAHSVCDVRTDGRPLHVVNPLEPTSNAAAASFRYHDVRALFRHAYLLLVSTDADVRRRFPTVLSRIVSVPSHYAARRTARRCSALGIFRAQPRPSVDVTSSDTESESEDEFQHDESDSSGVVVVSE